MALLEVAKVDGISFCCYLLAGNNFFVKKISFSTIMVVIYWKGGSIDLPGCDRFNRTSITI
jgi:hypothetical protein